MTIEEFFQELNYEGTFHIKGKEYEYEDSTIYLDCINSEIKNWKIYQLSVDNNKLIIDCF